VEFLMKKFSKRIVILMILLFVSLDIMNAQVIKLASVAPENSPYGNALNEIAAEWARISGGRVRLQIFHNGVAGNEQEVIQKMRIGQIQGAALTSVGLNTLSPRVITLSAPLLVQEDDELDFLLEELEEDFNEDLAEQNIVPIAWAKSGWIYMFSTDEIREPEIIQNVRFALSAVEPKIFRAFQMMGYQPISVDTTEMLTALNSGLVDTFLYSPLGVAAFQWFGIADNMLNIRISPFLGGIVLDNRTWSRVPANLKAELLEAAQEIASGMSSEIQALEEEAVDIMKGYGLNVVNLSNSETNEWITEFERGLEITRREVFPNDFLEKVIELLEDYRSRR
jgi:TRAP-type C4-dicarboxylate transport system substrate-binding protein